MPNIDNFSRDGFFNTAADLGITVLHLTTGEDILGHVWMDEANYRVERPVIPNIGSEDGRTFRIGLMPYRPYAEADKPLFIRHEYVMFTIDVNDQLKKVYTNFTSSIQVASPGDVPNLSIR